MAGKRSQSGISHKGRELGIANPKLEYSPQNHRYPYEVLEQMALMLLVFVSVEFLRFLAVIPRRSYQLVHQQL